MNLRLGQRPAFAELRYLRQLPWGAAVLAAGFASVVMVPVVAVVLTLDLLPATFIAGMTAGLAAVSTYVAVKRRLNVRVKAIEIEIDEQIAAVRFAMRAASES